MSIPSFQPGFRLIDGSDLNALVNLITLGAPLTFAGPNNTVQSAINQSVPGTVVVLAPGSYNEVVTIPRGAGPLYIYGNGPKGSVAIAPTAANSGAVVNNSDNVTFVNVGMAATGTGIALVNTGSRLRCYYCKLENDDATGKCAQMTLNTTAEHNATPRLKGNGADCLFRFCEFAWAASGLEMVCTSFGAVTELQIQDSWFHDLDTNHIMETVGSGGSAAVMFATLKIQGNTFQRDEAGTEPAKYILLNGSNANTGIVNGNWFTTALAGGKNLVSTALLWVSNYHTGGISGAQPS